MWKAPISKTGANWKLAECKVIYLVGKTLPIEALDPKEYKSPDLVTAFSAFSSYNDPDKLYQLLYRVLIMTNRLNKNKKIQCNSHLAQLKNLLY